MSRDDDRTLFADIFEPFDRAVNGSTKSEKPSRSSGVFNEGPINDFLKRNNSFGDLQTATPKRKKLNNETASPAPAAASPWEIRRLNGDLIEARAQVTRLEQRIDHQRLIGKEMTVLFETEKQTLINQKKRDEKTISELEERLKIIRERESQAKDQLSEKTKEFQQQHYEMEKKLQQLLRENTELRDKIVEQNFSHKSQIAETKKDMSELAQAYESAQQEVTKLRDDRSKQVKHTTDLASLQEKLDKQGFELQSSNNRVKELEHEIESYKDWLVQAKTAQKRLSTIPDLEREIARMKKEECHLREMARGKLLMEEKLYSLKRQVASLEPTQKELQKLQVQCACLEDALNEWKDVLRSVIPDSELLESEEASVLEKMKGGVGARMVLTALQRAQQTELLATNDKMESDSKVVQMKNEVSTAKHEFEKAKNKLADLEKLQIGQKSLVHRLQKRLSLVSRERDSYRNQLDCYEKELTITISGEGQSGNPLQTRVECLEKTLQEYRDVIEKLEKDNVGTADVEASPCLRDQLSRLRDEIQVLKHDNDLLRTRKDQLELQFEYRALKGDYDPSKYKILHMTNNPASTAQSGAQSDLEKAEAELKRLRQVIKRLESEGAEMSQRLSESMVGTSDSKEVQALRQALEGSKVKLQRMKEVFTTSSKEFRDVCYLLLGYKIDRVGQQYRLTSVYAESPEEYLNFTLRDGDIEMVQTDYLTTINELVNLHLHQHQSLPLFLSAHTVELFNRTTMMQEDEEEEEEE